VAVLVGLIGVSIASAERQWQKGTWREAKVNRPRVMFNVQPRNPNSNLPPTAQTREIRTYIIETTAFRLHLRQDTTADAPRIGALVGEPVTFAVEKKTAYVRDDGKEYKLSVTKQEKIAR
jgi:hypothetical protein